MKPRYRLILRRVRNGTFYCVDTRTNKRTSLKTSDPHEAQILLNARNEAARQPMLNLQIARAYLRGRLPGYRANEFRERCRGLGIQGVSLHSYRYAWAERAKTAGYPERFAQLALGHNSKAVHRAYARKAQVTLPPLEDYERNAATAAPVIPLPVSGTG